MIIKYTQKIDYARLGMFDKIDTKVLTNAARRTIAIGERESKAAYLKQRKKGGPSAIISSFTTDIKQASGRRVIGVIQAGGPSAPYTVWVDQGHKTRSGTWWSGYEFMKAGRRAMENVSLDILKDELNKAITMR